MLGEDGTLICYTDGSGIDDKYGAACLLMDELGGITSDKMRLSDHATVFQSEIKAITMACDLFMAKERDETKMVIHVDSQAALKALVANKTRSAMVWEAISKLRQIAKDRDVELRWVRAHVGHHFRAVHAGWYDNREIGRPDPES